MVYVPIKNFIVQVDEDIAIELHSRNVWLKKNGHVYLWDKKRISLSRWIMGDPKGYIVDHIDGNTLNNCRVNLRICTAQGNGQNKNTFTSSTGYKGVSYHKRDRVYLARIRHNGKLHHLGSYATAVQAAQAYDAAALDLFKEYAKTNKELGLL